MKPPRLELAACIAVAAAVVALSPLANVHAAEPAQKATANADEKIELEDLQPIGGEWFASKEKQGVYYYRDGGRLVDPFSYHMSDSNKDGVPNIRLRHDDRFLIIESQGYPNHPTAIYPNSGNPNSIRVQDFTFRLPLAPQKAKQITRLPMGPIGVALNGVVFFNPFEVGGMNAVEGYSEVWLDSCCGHPEQRGVYHYHKYPTCVRSPFADDGSRHSPVVGFAFDGFPIYGPYEAAKLKAKDLKGDAALDSCNGHSDRQRGYHYHVTPGQFPYIIGGYAGQPEVSNSPPLRFTQIGAIVNNARGQSDRIGRAIAAVHPAVAKAGKVQVRIEFDRTAVRRLPAGEPSWVQIGPFEAKKVERRGDTLLVEIEVDDKAPVGAPLDCHIEFQEDPDARPVVFKKNGVFEVAR